jgi:fused signal recognition particle receptor
MTVVLLVVAIVIVLGAGVAFVATRRGRGTVLEPPPAPPREAPTAPPQAPPAPAEAPPAPTEALPAPAPEVEAPPAPEPVVEAPPEPVRPKPTFRERLGRARSTMSGYVGSVLSRGRIDQETWDDLEEALIRADVGVGVTTDILDRLRATVAERSISEPADLLEALKDQLKADLRQGDRTLRFEPGAPNVWLFVGVNGVGKTTTIGKVGKRQADEGRSIVMAAGDTFRAAAAEQLTTWAERAGAELVRGAEGGDPSSIIFDAVQRAAARGNDLVLADTAGRLHTKVNLMDELRKVRRVADREPGKVTEVLLVLDATTGQNGLVQAQQFTEAVDLTGVVLTKLDGSAKGGIALAIQSTLGIPIKLVGLGESAEDLIDFDPDAFVDALFDEA